MSVSVNAFRWLDILEKEFDKAYVDLDLLLEEIDEDQTEIIDSGRTIMTVLSSCFAQVVHKLQTVSQSNAKLEAQLVDAQAEIVEIKADRLALEQQMKDTMARLQTSQLQCQILKHQGDIETAAKIQKNLEDQVAKQRDEFKRNVISDVKIRELEKENEVLKSQLINLQSEIYGARLTAKYLDKELAGRQTRIIKTFALFITNRIQQIQLLDRNLRGVNHENLWNQLESEIHLHRHKTVIRACRGREKLNQIFTTSSGHNVNTLQNRQHVGELRTVRFYKDAKEALGISITGGREHGLPILISEIHEDGLAWRCKQFYVGDTILSINKYDLRNVKHAEAVRILTALKGDITMNVVFVAPDDSDDESLSNYEDKNNLKYKFTTDEIEHSVKQKNIHLKKDLVNSNDGEAKHLLAETSTPDKTIDGTNSKNNSSEIDKYLKHTRQNLSAQRTDSKDYRWKMQKYYSYI